MIDCKKRSPTQYKSNTGGSHSNEPGMARAKKSPLDDLDLRHPLLPSFDPRLESMVPVLLIAIALTCAFPGQVPPASTTD